MNRRKFLTVLGGGVVLAAGAGATGYIYTRTPTKALAPWSQAGSQYSEPRKRALSYAILAPNPHNRQPWLVDLSQENRVRLYVDQSRLLPHTDPFNRQITIGLGCFLEIMRIAAAEEGYRVTFEHFPEGSDDNRLDKRPVADAIFVKDPSVKKDPLFAHILNRRSLKEPYDLGKNVSSDILAGVTQVVGDGVSVNSTNDMQKVEQLRKLTRAALQVEIDTPRTYKESVDLFRIGKAEIEKNPDGISFPGAKFEILNKLGMFTRKAAMDKKSASYQEGINVVLRQCDTAMAHVWLVTKTNTRIDQLNAGRDWVRVNLAATRAGVGIQPLSQALQEFEEMKKYYDQSRQMLAPEGGTIQMLARLGYAEAVSPTPRWPLSNRILKV